MAPQPSFYRVDRVVAVMPSHPQRIVAEAVVRGSQRTAVERQESTCGRDSHALVTVDQRMVLDAPTEQAGCLGDD